MLFKGIKLVLLGFASLTLVTTAMAQTPAAPKFGFEYRAGLTYDDHGIEDFDGNDDDPSATTDIALEVAKIDATGEAAKDVDYRFRYNFLENMLEYGFVKWKHSDMFAFSAGRQKVNQGGFSVKRDAYEQVAPSTAYDEQLPFGKYSDMFGLHVMAAGQVTLQVLNDVLYSVDDKGNPENGYKNDKKKGPAMTLEWMGDFSGWQPLLQVSSYDLNKSMYFVVGVKGHAAGLGLAIDYINDSRSVFPRNGKGELTGEDAKDTLTGINVEVDYALSGFTPWVEFHSFTNKQGDNEDAGLEDLDGNAPVATMMAAHTENYYRDNGTSISVGTNCNAMGEGYTPYVAVIQQSGKFLNVDGSGDTETLSNLSVKVGVFGKF